MDIAEKAGEVALDLAKNEEIQNKAVELLGMLFPYLKIKKEAIDLYTDEIKKSDLPAEVKVAALLNVKQTMKKLKNQNSIACIAKNNAKEGTDFSEQSNVDEEWFDRFMDSAAYVTVEEMQLVWGKILANEFDSPGSTPRNITRILSEFTKTYADAFKMICSMSAIMIQIDDNDKVVGVMRRIMVPFQGNTEYMQKQNLSFELLNELETLGVIKFDTVAGFAATHITTKKVLVSVHEKVIEIDSHEEDKVPIGNVLLTKAGEALLKITDTVEMEEPGYSDALMNYYKTLSVNLSEKNNYSVIIFGDKISVLKK